MKAIVKYDICNFTEWTETYEELEIGLDFTSYPEQMAKAFLEVHPEMNVISFGQTETIDFALHGDGKYHYNFLVMVK